MHGAAGGVGGLAVQIGKALGASPVIGTASTDERREFVMELGADAAIGYDEPDWPARGSGAHREAEAWTFSSNRSVVTCSSRTSTRWPRFGRYLLLGSTRGPGDPFAPRRLMTKSQAMVGFYLPVFYDRPELIGNALRFLADGVKDGRSSHRRWMRCCRWASLPRRIGGWRSRVGAWRHRPRPDGSSRGVTRMTDSQHTRAHTHDPHRHLHRRRSSTISSRLSRRPRRATTRSRCNGSSSPAAPGTTCAPKSPRTRPTN